MLSFGIIRRLTLGMALLGNHKLVILDNPIVGIDPNHKGKMVVAIKKHTKNCALLFSTRDVETVGVLGDRVAILNHGKIMAIGTAGEIIEKHGKGYTAEIHACVDRVRE